MFHPCPVLNWMGSLAWALTQTQLPSGQINIHCYTIMITLKSNIWNVLICLESITIFNEYSMVNMVFRVSCVTITWHPEKSISLRLFLSYSHYIMSFFANFPLLEHRFLVQKTPPKLMLLRHPPSEPFPVFCFLHVLILEVLGASAHTFLPQSFSCLLY